MIPKGWATSRYSSCEYSPGVYPSIAPLRKFSPQSLWRVRINHSGEGRLKVERRSERKVNNQRVSPSQVVGRRGGDALPAHALKEKLSLAHAVALRTDVRPHTGRTAVKRGGINEAIETQTEREEISRESETHDECVRHKVPLIRAEGKAGSWKRAGPTLLARAPEPKGVRKPKYNVDEFEEHG
ncbi:hypothetical protein B0H10DRAFT_1947844 [Mycena sp. CBHHK59/15]|nr:hypothetical protein B0H10DRAFT_1947844 [Mycena sp. CBHHK59/15]